MIKFFRHIRKSLIQQNKMGKYFKYAIGEIVLVVIGILIALQINNWNDNRKNDLSNVQLMEKLNNELQLNIDRLTYLKTFKNGYENRIKRNDTLKSILLKGTKTDDLNLIIRNFYFSSTLNLHTSTYEEMKSTGKLYTLGSESLINEIELYYRFCERQEYYVLEINNEVKTHINKDLNSGWFKLKQDYYAQGKAYALKDNSWILDRNDKHYNALIRLIDFSNFSLENILNRINRCITASKDLQVLVQNDLKNKN